MKLDQQFSQLDQEISQLSQQTGREVSRLDEEISTLMNQTTEDLCREVAALRRPSATDQRHQLSVGAEPFVPAPQGRTEPAAQDRQLNLSRHHQKIPKFDGKAPWEAYLAQFYIMANANGWGDSEKAYYLSTSIEGPALSMLANPSAEDRMDFPKLVPALENRFGAKHQQQQSRVLLNTMKRKKSEPLQELVENIERRVRLAYPGATGDVQEALTMHHLTTAVDERMQAELLRWKPRMLRDVLEVLTTEEAIRDCYRYQHTTPGREVSAGEEAAQQQHTASDGAFNAAVMRLTEVIQSQQAKPRDDQADSPRRTSFTGDCWYCLKKGHMKRDCHKWKFEKARATCNCWHCQKKGHMKRDCRKCKFEKARATGNCWYCQKKGQMKRDCRKRKYEKAGETKNKRENGDAVFRRSHKPCIRAEEKQDHSNECPMRRITLKPQTSGPTGLQRTSR